jgi:hypothetical protein
MSVWGSFVQLDSASLSAEFQGQMVSHVSSSSLPRISKVPSLFSYRVIYLSRNQISRKNIIPSQSSTREIWNITLSIYIEIVTFLVRFTVN